MSQIPTIPPKTIIVAGLDQMITFSGICAQDTASIMMPGKMVKVKPGGPHNAFVVETAVFSDLQPTNKAIVLDDISRGVGVDHEFVVGESITVAFLTAGVMFWGRWDDFIPRDIDIGEYVCGPRSSVVDSLGKLSRWEAQTVHPPMYGIALTKRDSGAEYEWVLVRYTDT